jgi:HPt (histidine-containing phosphotransfer) domain-containing protein
MPVFDNAKLHRRTMGDPSLQVEMLALFVSEAERLMQQVEDATEAHVRADRIRALLAVARNIGASRLAEEARAAEARMGSDGADLEGLKTAVAETLAFVRQREA